MKYALLHALSSQSIPANLFKLTQEPLNPLDTTNLDKLLEFIAQDSLAHSDLEHTQKELAYALLMEPYPFDIKQTQALTNLLKHEQLINLIFELLPTHAENITTEQQIIHHHVENLIAILAVRAEKPEIYQHIIHGKPTLANLLMRKRLETLTEPPNQRTLVFELLNQYQYYHWQDPSFSKFVHSKLVSVFLKLPEEEFKLYFKRYYSQHVTTHPTEAALLIEELLQSAIPTTWLQCSIQQDKNILQQPNFIHFFLSIPKLRQELLDNLLKTISNLHLLNLLLFLIDKKKTCIPDILNPILDCFCQRLFNASKLDHDPIHQWQTKDNASLVAWYLASRPSCFQLLSEFSSSVPHTIKNYTPSVLQDFGSYLTKNTPVSDLKNRSIAVIESLDDNALQFNKIALQLCCHFYETPQVLQTIFMNLELVNTSLKKQKQDHHQGFQNNYQHLKKACWELLTHHMPYDEKAAILLLTTKLNTPLCFDWFLITRIQHLISEKMPQNRQSCLQLIAKLPHFSDFILEFNALELQWLIINSPKHYLQENFRHWLDQFLSQDKFDILNIDILLSLLPEDPTFLKEIFAQDNLTPYLPKLFLQFTQESVSKSHLLALIQRVNTLSDLEKQALIITVQQLLFDSSSANHTLFILTQVLLSLKTLSINEPKAKTLIKNQLKLFNQIAQHQVPLSIASQELQQSLFNLLFFLNGQNTFWIKEILNDTDFAALAPFWLSNRDPTKQNHHPFTQLILEHTSLSIHPNLQNNPGYQHYLESLLSNPPESMTDDRFHLLFTQQLLPSNQQSLAKQLLQPSTVNQLSPTSRTILARTLDIQTLYTIAVNEQDNIPTTFIELLALHPNGLHPLSDSARNKLFSSLKNHRSLRHILNSQTSAQYKIQFVNHLFNYLLQHNIELLEWLETLLVDGKTLTALANYTTDPTHKKRLNDTIKSLTGLTSLREEIKAYLQHPTLNSPIEPESLLYSLIQDTFLNPEAGWQCDPQLLPIIKSPGAIQQKIIRRQFSFLTQINQLQNFYTPFDSFNNELEAPLAAARWLYQLPLLSQGLLQALKHYAQITSPAIKTICQETRLIQLIAPLFSLTLMNSSSPDNTRFINMQPNELYDLLTEYQIQIAPHDHQCSHDLDYILKRYNHKLQAMKHGSFPQAHDLIHPPSQQHEIESQKHLKNKDFSSLLNQASSLHQQFTEKTLPPHHYISSFINLFIQNPTWIQGDRKFQCWLFSCLTSPLTAFMSKTVLTQLLAHYPADMLTELLITNKKKWDLFQNHVEQLTQLMTKTSLKELLACLLDANLLTLLEVCEFAELPHLTNLIHFALQIKRIHQITALPISPFISYLLPSALTKDHELAWFKDELKTLDDTKQRLFERQNTLIQATFRYHPTTELQNLKQLAKLWSITTDLKTIKICLNSYGPLFKTDNIPLINEFLNTVITLVLFSPKADDWLTQLNPTLLEQMMRAALKSPQTYRRFITQLMDLSEPNDYLVLIQTQLTTLISRYQSEPLVGNLTLTDLSAYDIAQITPEDFKHILSLQHLLLQMAPPPDLTNWINDGPIQDRKMRHYFAADAGIYEHILNLPELTEATHLDEQTVKNYQTNLENAYQFLAHTNNVLIYGRLAEQFHQARASSIDPCALYHYLNLTSIVTADQDITKEERLEISRLIASANLPLDTLIRLHKNCTSKTIYPIYNIQLLTRPDFLTILLGKPMLNELHSNPRERLKKRLQSFILPIDLAHTPQETLRSLQPEAAATLFCSVPHFHQLNKENISILLTQMSAPQRDALINYWVHAYSNMPNYEAALLELTGLYPQKISTAIKQMPLSQRQKILSCLLTQSRQAQTIQDNQIAVLNQLMHDYLLEFEEDACLEQNRLELSNITHQLIGRNIKQDDHLQQSLLSQLWQTLQQSNGRMLAYALQKDSKKLIYALSLQKKPAQLLPLFDKALRHFNGIDHNHTKMILEKARAEAKFEDAISKLNFFQRIIGWGILRRCFFYGFFSSKKPSYLALPTQTQSRNTPRSTQTNLEKLTSLLNTVNSSSTNQDINSFFDILADYEQEPKNRDEEINLRRRIDRLFNEILNTPTPNAWIPHYKPQLLANRKQLIALYCASGQKEALNHLLTTTKNQAQFDDIIEEFSESQEEESPVSASHESLLSKTSRTAYDTLTSLQTSIQEGVQALTEPLRAVPDRLRAITAPLRNMPYQLHAAIAAPLGRVPHQLRAIPKHLRELPAQLRTSSEEWVSYVGSHFNFFGKKEERRHVDPNESIAQPRHSNAS